MQADVVAADVEQLGHFAQAEPGRLVFGPQLDPALADFGGVEDEHRKSET
jgi:hypothetical protein